MNYQPPSPPAILRWEEPPPRSVFGGHQMRFDPEVTLMSLRQRPGEWAVVVEGVSKSYRTSKGATALVEGGCELRLSVTDKARHLCTLYARYVGNAGAHSAA